MTPERRVRRGRHFFVLAGIFLGLGLGMLVGYAGPGVLIGLGLGIIATAFERGKVEGISEDTTTLQTIGPRWLSIIIGLFSILLGIGLAWAPLNIWPTVIAIFLVLLGIWFIARGSGWTR